MIKIVKIIKEFRPLDGKTMATQEKIFIGLYFSSTWIHRIDRARLND